MGVIAVGELPWAMRQQALTGDCAEPGKRRKVVHTVHCEPVQHVAAWFSNQLSFDQVECRLRRSIGLNMVIGGGSAPSCRTPCAHSLTSQVATDELNLLGLLTHGHYSNADLLDHIRRVSGRADFPIAHGTRLWPTSSCEIFAVLAFKPPWCPTSPAPGFARFRVAILGVGALLFLPRAKKILSSEPEVGDDRTCVPKCIRTLCFSDLFNLLLEFLLLREQFFKGCHRYLMGFELNGHCRGFRRKLSTLFGLFVWITAR